MTTRDRAPCRLRLRRQWTIVAAMGMMLVGAGPLAAADLEFAHGLYRDKRFQLAADEYAAVLKAQPTGKQADEASFFLAESLLQLGKEQQTLPYYKAIVQPGDSARPYYRMSLFRLGELQFNLGDYKSAEPMLARFLKEFPTDDLRGHAAYLLGESLLSLNDLPGAEAALQRAAQAKPADELANNIRHAQAKLAERQGRIPEARQIYDALSKTDSPFADDSMLAVGALDFQQQRFDAALAVFEQLPRRFPKSPLIATSRLNLGLCLTQLRRFDEAIAIFKGLAESPGSGPEAQAIAPEAWYRWGLCELAKEDYDRATVTLREGARRFPRSAQAADMDYHAALAEYQAGKFRAAKSSFLAFTSQFPNSPLIDRAWHYVGRAAMDCNEPETVLGVYRRLSQDHPDSEWRDRSAVTVAEAMLADPTGTSRQAMMAKLLENTRHAPSRQRLQYYSAVLLFDQKDYKGAIEAAQALLASKPSDDVLADAQYLLGVCLVKASRWQESIEPLETYLAGNTKSAMASAAVRALAEALAHLPETATSKESLTRLVATAQALPDAAQLVSYMADQQYAQGRHATAGRLYERLLALQPKGEPLARALVGLGWCLLETKQPAPAYEQFAAASRVTHDQPTLTAESLYMTGVTGQQVNKSAEALAAFQKVFDDFPQSDYQADAGHRIAELLTKSGKADEADRIYETMTQRLGDSPRVARVLYERAWLALDRDKKDAASLLFWKLADSYPKSEYADEALIKLAELSYDRKEYAEAEEYTRALEQRQPDPKFLPALYYRRGLTNYKLGKREAAQQAFQTLVSRFGSDPLAPAGLFWLGEIDFEQNKSDEAAKSFRDLLTRPGSDKYRSTAQLRLAQCDLQAKRWKEAFDQAEAFLAQNQDPAMRSEGLFVQGRALQQQARFDDARKRFEQIIGPERTELAAKSQFMTAETYFHQQRYDEALKAFLKVEILYDFPEWQSMALLQIGKLHEKLSEPAAAKEAYEKLLQKFPDRDAAKEAKSRLGGLAKAQ